MKEKAKQGVEKAWADGVEESFESLEDDVDKDLDDLVAQRQSGAEFYT